MAGKGTKKKAAAKKSSAKKSKAPEKEPEVIDEEPIEGSEPETPETETTPTPTPELEENVEPEDEPEDEEILAEGKANETPEIEAEKKGKRIWWVEPKEGLTLKTSRGVLRKGRPTRLVEGSDAHRFYERRGDVRLFSSEE